ncbi:sodium- and chloride-dependent GABA transporter ine isoform X2 [Neodiprion pinetum]|uniref:sodium- and chloride-dependent GABA transporter ine isoform X2 n=1 Tax=Neodiprion pinetum TaxID=441929 RepID=UPI001EDE11A6|nr:sodium- and chloride-dependent GABA transporter ine-like isoform X2 [Neodiprion pinetum]
MESSNSNGNGATMISDNKASLLKQHANNNRLNVIGKQNNMRKMSTMPEEDGSDADPDAVSLQPIHQHQQDPDSDSPSEGRERGRLLSSGSRKIMVTPASMSSIASTNNGIKRSSSGNSSIDSVHDAKQPARIPQSRLAALEAEPRLYRDGSTHGAGGRITRGIELHGSRHRYPSMRSLKSTAADDHHQHNHHPATSWASIIFSDAASQSGKPFPDSVSIRSLASIGMGSSDGRKLTIRRVPTSPSELLNMVHPPTPIEDDLSTCSSYDDVDAEDPGDYRQPKRPHWANKVQFVLACIGYSVGLGNVWRFPYLCYKSGGDVQPWSECNDTWHTNACWTPAMLNTDNRTRPNTSKTPSEDFFENKVLQISNGIEEPGALRWELVACLVTAWVMVYFSIWKSIRSSAQVRYLTATLPFLLIIVFLTRSLTLEGADKGLQYFFRPRWALLADAKVWVNAAAQIFNSVGIAFGSMICFASYNKFHNNILIDTVAVSLINAFSSLLVGIFAFATIGNIAREQNMSVEDVLSDGPGLVFVVYPQALAKMPASQLWAVLFFFMLVCLSLNSQFAIVEVVVTSIQDGFPNWIKRLLLCHEILVLIICVVSFLFGLPNLTRGGIFFFQLIDHYAASISIMFLAFFEVIAISWFYGVQRLCSNVKEMTGRMPSIYFRFCWLVAAPLLIMAVWVFSLIDYEPPTYHNGAYIYPWWAEAIGWGIASLSLVCIPAVAIYVLIRAEGDTFLQRLRKSIKPDFEACRICGQEYCTEPLHTMDEDSGKEPLHELNSLIQQNSTYIPPKSEV